MDGEGVVDWLGGVAVEGGVGVVGVSTGVSVATGDSWVGGNVMGAFGLQPGSSMDIRIRATKTPCFMIASGLFAVSYTRESGNHIML